MIARRSIPSRTSSHGIFRLFQVDVCRETIYFQSVSDMIACMRVISEERELVVVRVKNRMQLEEEDLLSIGFRHVCINVRVQNYEAEQARSDSVIRARQIFSPPAHLFFLSVFVPTVPGKPDQKYPSQRGVESHVCEILLVLVSFAELMTAERHARYVTFRDIMGT